MKSYIGFTAALRARSYPSSLESSGRPSAAAAEIDSAIASLRARHIGAETQLRASGT